MRILFLTQWFQPEPVHKGLAFAEALKARGHEVEVLTGFPNYPGGKLYDGYRVKPIQREWMNGLRVTRTPLYPSHDKSALKRVFTYCSFALSSALVALTLKRPDVVYVYFPPSTAAAAAVALRLFKRVPFIVDVQDLWPETLATTGMVNSGLLVKTVGAWTNFAFRRSSHIVVLSPGFKAALEDRRLGKPITVIPNWAPPDIEQAMSLPPPFPDQRRDHFNVLFAGNMGPAQALGVVLEAAKRLKQQASDIRFTMIGRGVDTDALRAASEAAGTDNVVFLGARHPKDMGPVFAEADALLVHLRDDPLFEITIPSKTQAYLTVGKPILMGVRGDAARMVEGAGAGLAFQPEDADALVEAVVRLRSLSPEQRAEMGRAGAAFYRRHLAFDQGVAAFETILSETARPHK